MNIVGWQQLLAMALLCGLMLVLLWREAMRHQKHLGSFKLRIHVNGTRGKSSVTRLIAAGLRAGGHHVVAKTTGSAAKVLLPDGTEQYIQRRGPANIREMIKIAALAYKLKADAIVFECMAVQPELQRFSEQVLMKAHIGVITNVRPDHEEIMGKGLEGVGAALAGTIPVDGRLVTTLEAYPWLCPGAQAGEASHCVDPAELPDEYLTGFPYEILRENLALALKVCELAGVDPITALAGMRQSVPDIGNLTITRHAVRDKEYTLINAFAANDPESTVLLWRQYVRDNDHALIWFNTRADRRYRTAQLAEVLSACHSGVFLLSGDAAFARRELIRRGVRQELLYILPTKGTIEAIETAVRRQQPSTVTIFAAGNMAGIQHLPAEKLTGAGAACTSYSSAF